MARGYYYYYYYYYWEKPLYAARCQSKADGRRSIKLANFLCRGSVSKDTRSDHLVYLVSVLLHYLNHAQLGLVVRCIYNLRLQSQSKQRSTVSMRSQRGLSTTLHCLQWYKLTLVLRVVMAASRCSSFLSGECAFSINDRKWPTSCTDLRHSGYTRQSLNQSINRRHLYLIVLNN